MRSIFKYYTSKLNVIAFKLVMLLNSDLFAVYRDVSAVSADVKCFNY